MFFFSLFASQFYSHVQKVAAAVTSAGLKEAVKQHALVLREDPEGTKRLRRAAMVAFYQEHATEYAQSLIDLMDSFDQLNQYKNDFTEYEEWISQQFENVGISAPAAQNLVSLRAEWHGPKSTACRD